MLDDGLLALLLPLLEPHRYEIIDLDGGTIYVHPRVLVGFIGHLIVTRRPQLAYALAVLEWMKPRLVVTCTDNSTVFQMAAQRYRPARFLAIQGGGRLLDRDNPPGSPVIYHREFACLGRYEVDQFKRHGAMVGRYYPIGSLRDAYYRSERARNGGVPAKQFDLCLVSQFRPGVRFKYSERLDGFELLTRHVRRFCESHGTALCIPLRKSPESNREIYEWEREFFETRLAGLAEIRPNDHAAYTTYELVDRSRVSIGMHTTVLREGFGRGNRILSCNYTGNPVYSFPVPGPWTLEDPSYERFEERLTWLLTASEDEYARLCGDAAEYLISYDEHMPTQIFLRNLIGQAVNGEASGV